MKRLESVVYAVKSFLQPQSTSIEDPKPKITSGNAPTIATEQLGEIPVATIANMPETEPVKHCRRCGRILKSRKSKALGYGLSCYKKHVSETIRMRPLFVLPIVKPEDPNENH